MSADIWTPDPVEDRSVRIARERVDEWLRTRPTAVKRALLSGEIALDPDSPMGIRLVPAKSQDELDRRHRIAASAPSRDAELSPEEQERLGELINAIDAEYLIALAKKRR